MAETQYHPERALPAEDVAEVQYRSQTPEFVNSGQHGKLGKPQ